VRPFDDATGRGKFDHGATTLRSTASIIKMPMKRANLGEPFGPRLGYRSYGVMVIQHSQGLSGPPMVPSRAPFKIKKSLQINDL
jgi:hypothetical protein